MRMPEERWLAVIHSRIPAGRRTRERPRRSWRDGVTEAMERGEEDGSRRRPGRMEDGRGGVFEYFVLTSRKLLPLIYIEIAESHKEAQEARMYTPSKK
jgi:hypothetical protein